MVSDGTKIAYLPLITGSSYPVISNFRFFKDFTIECFAKSTTTNYATFRAIFCTRNSSLGQNGVWLGSIPGTGKISCYDNSSLIFSTNASISSSWTHYALVRCGSIISLFINGNLVTSANYYGVLGGGWLSVLGDNLGFRYASSIYPFIGAVDELRVTQCARYLNNFTPPAAPYPSGPGYAY